MSWRDSLVEAQARLAALEAAELAAFSGGRVTKVMANNESVEYAQQFGSLAALQRAISEARIVVRRLSGGAGGGGIVPVMR